MIGANREDTRDITVISVLREGPAVSLNGSPTVSPMTPALWASEPGPPNSPDSMNFLALSQAPPSGSGTLPLRQHPFRPDGITDTSTTLRQAQDGRVSRAQCRPDRGVSWVLVPSGFPPVLTGCGCSAIMSGKVTMGIRQKSAHGVIIQEDFRKCNPVDCLGGFRLRYRNSGGRRIPYKK